MAPPMRAPSGRKLLEILGLWQVPHHLLERLGRRGAPPLPEVEPYVRKNPNFGMRKDRKRKRY